MSKILNIWVVVPAYNEGRSLSKFLSKLRKVTTKFIVVDDGSKDSTYQVSSKYTKHTLSHPINIGKGAAMKTGCEYAFGTLSADGVIFMDGDGQHHPKELRKFTKKILEGHDIVFGVRTLDVDMPFFRIAGNKVLSLLIKIFFGKYVPDILSGYKALTKHGYKLIKWDAQSYDVETEIVVRTIKSATNFATISISTIYNRLDRGMTLQDALLILPRLVEWRLTI